MEAARFWSARVLNGQYFDGMAYGVLREAGPQRHPDGWATAQTDMVVEA
ncbi:hypothetical protein QWZ03_11855 [Chitinimonas viridis]|uniref:GNAT family N-acetyltransferase n=1 Tax=Chitinimonas viridis TaxID=664880 RepID=A0ABT8B5E8_9NEIS|nr:hypothetical protein [Chitinimonas viridis]MDN3577462.1 hypothetical protein [Chitinimonas viridis]